MATKLGARKTNEVKMKIQAKASSPMEKVFQAYKVERIDPGKQIAITNTNHAGFMWLGLFVSFDSFDSFWSIIFILGLDNRFSLIPLVDALSITPVAQAVYDAGLTC